MAKRKEAGPETETQSDRPGEEPLAPIELPENALTETSLFAGDRYEPVRTRGKKVHLDKNYTVSLEFRTAYELLNLLEEFSIKEESFLEVRRAVLLRELIAAQLKRQGY